MKNIVSVFFALLLFSPMSSIAGDRTKISSEIVGAYLRIQEALANDSMDGVANAASELVKNTNQPNLKGAAETLSRDLTLKGARTHFKTLSLAMNQWAKSEKPAGIDRYSCSMAHAPWLQKHGPIKNPYYGKQMQSCGELQK